MLAIFAWAALAALLWSPYCFWCCAPSTWTLTVTVRKCGTVLVVGETVTVKLGGTTVGTGTTNGSGVATFTLPAGSYTITTTAPAHYDAGSGSATITSFNVSVTITLTPSAGYSCTPDPCYLGLPGPPYVNPATYPATMFVDDGFGLVTLTQTAGAHYFGTANRPAALAWPYPLELVLPFCVYPDKTPQTVPVNFYLSCPSSSGIGSGPWQLIVTCYDAKDDSPTPSACVTSETGQCITNLPAGPGAVFYPSTDTRCGDSQTIGSAHGDQLRGYSQFTPSGGFPAFSGSVTLDFGSASGAVRAAPYQIYGGSYTFLVTQ